MQNSLRITISKRTTPPDCVLNENDINSRENYIFDALNKALCNLLNSTDESCESISNISTTFYANLQFKMSVASAVDAIPTSLCE